jgi:hypothetical protein
MLLCHTTITPPAAAGTSAGLSWAYAAALTARPPSEVAHDGTPFASMCCK